MKHERTCAVCGTKYSYCPDCNEYAEKPRWMFLFHDENCMNIWAAINDYKAGKKDAAQTKAALQRLDLSKRDSFDESYQAIIKKICAETEPKPKQTNNNNKKYSEHH